MAAIIMNTFERRLVHSVEHSEEIHSGHYMVSNIDDSESETDEPDVLYLDDNSKDAMETSSSKDKNWLEFEDLASLFRYLEIAYTDQLTSPKWNQFRGLRFAVKNKIRLNNIIWREYHMQYVKKVKPYIVQFQAPLTENHAKIEAIVMEGKYWKRRISTVCQEYRSWRLFAKNKMHGPFQKHISACVDDLLGPPTYSFQKTQDDLNNLEMGENDDCTFSPTTLLEDIMMDFDENLDLFFEQPLTFPNPKDLAMLGIGDIMQPGLLQFEPNNNSPPESIHSQFSSPSVIHPKSGKRNLQETRVSPENNRYVRRSETSINNNAQSKSLIPGTVIDSDITMKLVSERSGKVNFVKPPISTKPPKTQLPENAKTQTCLTSDAMNYSQSPRVIPSSTNQCASNVPTHSYAQQDSNTYKTLPVKHSVGQQYGSSNRRPHTVKHYPTPAAYKHRHSISGVVHSNDKTLRQLFRNGYLDSSVVDSEPTNNASNSPALTALLHGPELHQRSGVTSFEAGSRRSEDVRTNCSVPLLCSALTTPLSTHSTCQGPVPALGLQNNFLKGRQDVEGPRYPVVGTSSSLITDSLRPSDDLRSITIVDHTTDSFKLDSSDQLPFPTSTPSSSQELYLGSILKSSLTSPSRPLLSAPLLSSVPDRQHIGINEISANEPFFTAGNYSNEVSNATSSRYITTSKPCVAKVSADAGSVDSSHLLFKSNDGKTVESGVLSSQSIQCSPDLEGSSFLITAQSNRLSSNPTNPPNLDKQLSSVHPGFSHSSFSAYTSLPPMREEVRSRTNSANNNFNCTTSTTNNSTVAHESWNEPTTFSYPPVLNSKNWDPNVLKAPQRGGFFISSQTPDQVLAVNKEESDVRNVNFQVNSSQSSPLFSSRGRSSSAGNLFPLPQPLLSYAIKPSSSKTMSSYGSTEVLSPQMSSQSNFLGTSSPSCSPPPASTLFDSELPGRGISAGNSSEEIRRQSMHSALQTLRRLVHLHSTLDGPSGGSRLAIRRRMEMHEYRTSVLGTGSRLIDDIEDDMYPSSGYPKNAGTGDTGCQDSYNVGTSESGTSYRATKAATLRRAAELIREMRERRNALDARLNSLKTEMETLKNAINTWCGKLTPSSSNSSQPPSDPYLHSRSKAWFHYYVKERTERCWKFYVYSLILSELFQSYCTTVNTTSREHFVRSLFGWLDQHGSLVHLRLAAPRAMCRLSTTTSILRDPSQLPEQSVRAAAEMNTISLDVPVQMRQESGEKSTFDAFNPGRIST